MPDANLTVAFPDASYPTRFLNATDLTPQNRATVIKLLVKLSHDLEQLQFAGCPPGHIKPPSGNPASVAASATATRWAGLKAGGCPCGEMKAVDH